MRVAVTGGSGVVGRAVVRHLVDSGHEVRALARSRAAGSRVASLGAAPVPGHVLDYQGLVSLVEGCRWVFHVAGVNEMCTRDPDHMWRVNVEGTRLVMNASRETGVQRLIHTSSAVTIGEEEGTVATESSPHRGFYFSEYERTKSEAERVLFSQAGPLDVVAVNPSSVQGPGRATGTGKIVLAAARGKLPFLIDTTISLVDIDDCARGHLLAAERGESGERYLLSGVTVEMAEAVQLVSQAVGQALSPRMIGERSLSLLGAVVETAYRLIGRQPPICREMVRVMTHGHRYDGSRAMLDLGLEYTPVEETLDRTISWFRSEGLLTS